MDSKRLNELGKAQLNGERPEKLAGSSAGATRFNNACVNHLMMIMMPTL